MNGDYAWLALYWLGWCALHSALAGTVFARPLEAVCGRYYRLFYNAFSALTLWPLWLFTKSIRAEYIWVWDGWMRGVQVALLLAAGLLFALAARRYDMKIFLGLAPTERGLSTAGLDRGGVLAFVRHPWYLAALLLVWARDLTLADMVVNAVLVGYLWGGALLEERKLVQTYGEDYSCYQAQVSMLIPWKWLQGTVMDKSAS
jgi:protein-S-isoprenylcysteine O-methyltransferase Ste14